MGLVCEVNRQRIPNKTEINSKKDKFTDFFLEDSPNKFGDASLQLTFDIDPLYEVVALVRNGWEPYQVYSAMYDPNNTPGTKITDEDREAAERVRRHFQYKYLMRQLQQKSLSKFQETVLRLLDSPAVLYGNEISPLVKLYTFYLEDKATENIFKNAESIPNTERPLIVDGPVQFAGAVERTARNEKFTRYFWRTEDNYLLKLDASHRTAEQQAWRVISKLDEIYVRGDIFTLHLHGYEYIVADMKRSLFEILN